MLGLLISTIVTSATDSLNPIAITQQFILQGLVKKAKHIWYFIIPIVITNIVAGLLAYYGILSIIADLLRKIFIKYSGILFIIEFFIGIMLMIFVLYKVFIKSRNMNSESNKKESTVNFKSVSPLSLVFIGVGTTIAELTTALPFFAFLAIVYNYQLSFIELILLLIFYNLIYALPMIIMYIVYIKAQHKFVSLYNFFKRQMAKMGNIIMPCFLAFIGIFLISHSVYTLIM